MIIDLMFYCWILGGGTGIFIYAILDILESRR